MVHNTLKNLVASIIIILLIGCESPIGPGDFEEYNNSGTVYCSVPDIPEIELDDAKWQTLKPVDGELSSEEIDVQYIRVSFQSDMFWIVGDTTGYFKSNCRGCQDGVWYDTDGTVQEMYYDFHTMAPVTNQVSLAREDGTFRNMLAPVKSMKGDAMWLWWSINGTIIDSMSISLF